MHEFSYGYEEWFTAQATQISGGSLKPRPPTPFDARFPYDHTSLFAASPYKNAAGRFASLATTATLGKTICDDALFVSLARPCEPPPWMSSTLADAYRSVLCWDDLARSMNEGAGEPFWRVLARTHIENILQMVGKDRSSELRERLDKELDPLMQRIRKILQNGHGVRMSDHAFKELVVSNLGTLIYVRQAYCMAVQHDHSYAVVPLTEEIAHGLVISVAQSQFHGPTRAVVLTL